MFHIGTYVPREWSEISGTEKLKMQNGNVFHFKSQNILIKTYNNDSRPSTDAF